MEFALSFLINVSAFIEPLQQTGFKRDGLTDLVIKFNFSLAICDVFKVYILYIFLFTLPSCILPFLPKEPKSPLRFYLLRRQLFCYFL